MRRIVSAVTVALLAAGCAGQHQEFDRRPAIELAGRYTAGEGASWLLPCPADATAVRRWLTFTGGTVAIVDKAKSDGILRPDAPVYLRVRGVAAAEVGPDGNGIVVQEILEIRPTQPGDCAAR